MALSRHHKYAFRDEDEVAWKFQWELVGERVGWWAWFLKPTAKEWFCQGLITEDELESRLNANPPKLQDDDVIELGIFLNNWPPEIVFEERESEEITIDSSRISPSD